MNHILSALARCERHTRLRPPRAVHPRLRPRARALRRVTPWAPLGRLGAFSAEDPDVGWWIHGVHGPARSVLILAHRMTNSRAFVVDAAGRELVDRHGEAVPLSPEERLAVAHAFYDGDVDALDRTFVAGI